MPGVEWFNSFQYITVNMFKYSLTLYLVNKKVDKKNTEKKTILQIEDSLGIDTS